MTRGARAALGVVLGHALVMGGFLVMVNGAFECTIAERQAPMQDGTAVMYGGIAVIAWGFAEWAASKGRSRWFALLAPLSWIGCVILALLPRGETATRSPPHPRP